MPLVAVLVAAGQAAIAEPRPALAAEERTAARLEEIRRDPIALRPFLRALPKGGDLHMHLTGSVYAESYLRWAAEDALCVDASTHTILAEKEPCDAAKGRRPAKDAARDGVFHDALVDAMSVRYHHAARGAGEYQFFGAFRHLGPLTRSRRGEMLAEVRRRAASQNVRYLEITSTWDVAVAYQAAEQVEWSEDLGVLRERLLAAGLREAPRTTHLDAAETRARQLLRCGTAEAEPACSVIVRYHAESYRGVAPVAAFAMMVWSFLQNEADPRFVGINLVMPEDGPISLRDYDLHMRMLAFLRGLHPGVNVSLHAGELGFGQVPPEELGTHVEKAIRVAGAQRIGHGSDVAYHPRPLSLMEEMKRRDVAVEVCLSSADVILGLRGEHHPLRTYLKAGVPVVLATDDEGVARSDLTNEYQRAVLEHGLGYRELKRISRDSLRYAFLDPAEKRRLLDELEAAFARFESSTEAR